MKTVLISGAAGNLGEKVVKAFTQAEYQIEAAVKNVVPYQSNSQVNYTAINLSDEKETALYVDKLLTKHRRIDAAALLAGGFGMGSIVTTTYADIEQMLALNFKTAYTLIMPMFTHMAENEGGKIIVVASRIALQPYAGAAMLAYTLSKSMLVTLAEMLNAEGQDKNITVHVIAPGTIDTQANRESMPNADFSTWVKAETLAQKMVELCEAPFTKEASTVHTFY